MRRGTPCRVADCRRMRADMQRSSSFAASGKSRALAGRGLLGTVLIWLALVLAGCAAGPRPDYPRTPSTAFAGLRVHQAGPILRSGGRGASGPLRLQPYEPGPRGLHHPSGAGRLGRAKPGHAVLHLGRRYDRPDHTRPRAARRPTVGSGFGSSSTIPTTRPTMRSSPPSMPTPTSRSVCSTR